MSDSTVEKIQKGQVPDVGLADPEILLEAHGVWKWLGTGSRRSLVLRDITLSVRKGSWTRIAGASGSGKTTLLSLLGALDRPSRGEILFDGEDLTHLSNAALAHTRRRIGFVFQGDALIARLPLWENVTYPLIPRGVGTEARYRRAEEVLERVGLAGYEERRPEELSGGERQRASIARALAGDPELLLADEPTSSLDAESAEAVWTTLRDLHRKGRTILVATHASYPTSLTDRHYELHRGELISDISIRPDRAEQTPEF